MGMKTLIKRMGRGMFSLKQDDNSVLVQSVLVTDNGYCRLADLFSGIEKIRACLPCAKISVLTLAQRQLFLQNELPGVEFIICPQKLRPRRYRIALTMLFMQNKNFDQILNFSLDPPLLIIQLLLFKSRIILYNQWGQWCSLRLRRASEIFTTAYHKQRSGGLKNFLKKIGLFFVLLTPDDEKALRHNVLIVDNAAIPNQLIYTVRRVRECLPISGITVLTVDKLKDTDHEFRGVKIIRADKFWIRRYRIARHMLKLKRDNYDYVILFSLDITPVVISALLFPGRMLLRNQWHQWWRLNLKPARYYLMLPPQLAVGLVTNIFVFIYLALNVSWIFMLRAVNVFKIKLSNEGT
jgi:hypothetical protein